jgi:hypothetical protein
MKPITFSLVFVACLAVNATVATADTLLVERVQAESAATLPARGNTMDQVQARFGAPAQKYPPVGGPNNRKHNPPITRWAYPTFNVYFEYNHVVDAVLIKATPMEMGPAPVQN